MNPKIGEYYAEGWVLKANNGLFLYKYNPNPEYEDMHLEMFGRAAYCDFGIPLIFVTKYEASDKGKEWNALLHRKCNGVFCISKDELVHPVKVKISIEEA